MPEAPQHQEQPQPQQVERLNVVAPNALDKAVVQGQQPHHQEKRQQYDRQGHSDQQQKVSNPNALDKAVVQGQQPHHQEKQQQHDRQGHSDQQQKVPGPNALDKLVVQGQQTQQHYDRQQTYEKQQLAQPASLMMPNALDKLVVQGQQPQQHEQQPQQVEQRHSEQQQSGAAPNALDKAGQGQQTRQSDRKAPMSLAHARGEMGERDAAFALGKMGLEVIIGPGGDQGHELTTRGIDQLAFDPKSGSLWIIDNKATDRTAKIRDASALTKNVVTNLETTYQRVKEMGNLPYKDIALQKLEATVNAITNNKNIPNDVKLVITNAGGFATGISKDLAAKGVTFFDVVGPSTIEAHRQDIRVAEFVKALAQQAHITKSIETAAQLIQEAQVNSIYQHISDQAEAEFEGKRTFIESLLQQGQFVVVSMVLEEPKQIDLIQNLGGPRQIPVYRFLTISHGRTEEEALHPKPSVRAVSPEEDKLTPLPKGPDENHTWRSYKLLTLRPY